MGELRNFRHGWHTNQQNVPKYPSINDLLPSSLVDLLISEVRENGILGTVMGSIEATCDVFHSRCVGGPAIDETLEEGQTVKGSYYRDGVYGERKVHLFVSLLPHVVSLQSPSTTDPLESLPYIIYCTRS